MLRLLKKLSRVADGWKKAKNKSNNFCTQFKKSD